MKTEVQEHIQDNKFAIYNYRRFIYVSIFLSILSISLTCFSVYKFLTSPKSITFATTTDGNIIPIHAQK